MANLLLGWIPVPKMTRSAKRDFPFNKSTLVTEPSPAILFTPTDNSNSTPLDWCNFYKDAPTSVPRTLSNGTDVPSTIVIFT